MSWHQTALEWCDSFASYLKEHDIKDIVFLGDFFHNRASISVNTLHIASVFLNKLKDFDIKMILGNHDLHYTSNYEISGVNLFSMYPNITVYSKPELVQMGSKSCYFCGWGYDPMAVESDILFTHAAISLFKMNVKSEACDDGFKPSELLKKHRQIITGHFHVRQEKTYKNGEIIYPGNPFQMDFSDEGLDKGFMVYDTESSKYEFVNNTISPRFIRYNLLDLAEITNFKALGEELKNSYFRLIINASIMTQDLNLLMSLINGCGTKNSEFEWENGRSFSQDIEELDAGSFELCDAIKEYVMLLDIPYKDDITEYLLSLLIKVSDN